MHALTYSCTYLCMSLVFLRVMPALRRANLDAKDSVAVVAVHLSKAVNHNLLLTKLKAHVFSTTATNFKELRQRSKD